MAEVAERKGVASKSMTMDGKPVSFSPGDTILQAARKAGIYIPTLCAAADLPSTGACRLCLVKVEGMRGLPTSCTTPAAEGMVVVTDSGELSEVRRGVLELILSEHPSACLFCPTKDRCDRFEEPVQKAGRVTGCNMCSGRDCCEIRVLVERLGLKDVRYPFLYKDFLLERDDPFMDRDYNLCVLCGRCIRACETYRGSSAISFVGRGHGVKVGTAFGRLHVDGDCVFCMHCVDACPNGTLSVRGSKWNGKPERSVATACVLCERGCPLTLDVGWDKVMGARPAGSACPADGDALSQEYCVKGRCCLPALLGDPNRLKYPAIKREDGKIIYADWDKAVSRAREVFSRYAPAEILVIGSRWLTDEAVQALSVFARVYADSKLLFAGESGIAPGDVPKGIKLLYATEANSLSENLLRALPLLEAVLVEDIHPSPLSRSDKTAAVLPAAAFTEADGTKTCSEGRKARLAKVVEPPGNALPDAEIILRLGKALGKPDFTVGDPDPKAMAAVPAVPKDSQLYRGFFIGDFVPDFKTFVERRKKQKGEVRL